MMSKIPAQKKEGEPVRTKGDLSREAALSHIKKMGFNDPMGMQGGQTILSYFYDCKQSRSDGSMVYIPKNPIGSTKQETVRLNLKMP